jgi:ribosomal protein S6
VERIKKLVFAPTGLFTEQKKIGYTKMVKKINKNKNAYVRIWDFCVLGFLLRGLN